MKSIYILTLIALTGLFFTQPLNAQQLSKLQAKAARIHQSAFTVDSHTDAPLNFTQKRFDISKDNSPQMPHSCVDFPRMRKGGLDAVFLAAFVGQGARTPEGNTKAFKRVETIIDSIHSATKKHADVCGLATTPEQAYNLVNQHKSVVFIGIENGYAIGNELSLVKHFYERGARYITLCHTKNNDICTSSTDTANSKGLSEFGKQVVKEMNRLGMMVDVSHISDASFYDVLKLTKAPVIASHSCSRAMCNNPRNLTDDQLRALAKNGGVVQMCILSAYVKTPPPNPARDSAQQAIRKKYNNFEGLKDEALEKARDEYYATYDNYPQPLASVSQAVDHIDHMVKVAGIKHVGIGTDFDGGGGLSDCKDVSQMGNITLELVKRGYTARQIKMIWGGNLMRVMHQVEKAAPKSML